MRVGSPGRSVASLPGHGPTASAEASASATPSQAQSDQDIVDFTHCLRAHGVNEPDPFTRPGHSGLSFELPPEHRRQPPGCRRVRALHLQDRRRQAGGREPRAGVAGSPRSSATPPACARSDVPMLDPGPQGQLNLGNVPGITSDFGRYSPQFRAADQRLPPPPSGGRPRRRDRAVTHPGQRSGGARGRRGRVGAAVALAVRGTRRPPPRPTPRRSGRPPWSAPTSSSSVLTEATLGYEPQSRRSSTR